MGYSDEEAKSEYDQMKPGDLLVVTREMHLASWYPGMIGPSRRGSIKEGTLMLLLSVYSTTFVALTTEFGFTPFYIYDWDSSKSFKVVS